MFGTVFGELSDFSVVPRNFDIFDTIAKKRHKISGENAILLALRRRKCAKNVKNFVAQRKNNHPDSVAKRVQRVQTCRPLVENATLPNGNVVILHCHSEIT